MDDKWLYNLKKRSENFERKVPDGLWDGIEQALGKQQDVVGNRKRIVPLWSRRLAVAAAVAVVVTVGFFALMDTEQTQQSVDKANSEIFGNNVVRSRENMEVKESSLIAEVDESGKVLTCKTVGASDLLPVATFPGVETELKDTVMAETKVEAGERKKEDVGKDRNNKNNKGHSVFDNVSRRRYDYGNNAAYKPVKLKTDGGGKWSAGLYASNLQGESSSSQGYKSFVKGANAYSEMPSPSTWATSAKADIMFNNLNETTETKMKHHLPVRVGASVKYALTDRWGIESGLVYTMLKSELTSGSENYYYATEQTVHYLGVPLKANFIVWQNERFKAYVNGGGMMEIPLSGKSVTNYVNRGSATEQERDDVNIDRLQWSVSGAVGFQYNFNDNIGIYVEPGVGYYFDDGSDVLTVYKDKPFNFNLQVGVRFEIN